MEGCIKGLIFDLDGVIVFTDRYHYQAWKKIADRLGIYFDEEMNHRLRGVSRMESLEIILENYCEKPFTAAEKERLAEEKNTYYCELLKTMQPHDVVPEIRETLEELRKKGYRLAVGSSSKNARMILKQVDLIDAFDVISDGTNISRSKPDPEVFLKAAQYLGLQPEECAVIEDARAGIDAAKAGKMLAVGIGDAAGYERTDVRVERIEELLKF